MSKIKNFIRSTNNDSDHFDGTYVKIKFISDDNLPPTKTWELYDIIIIGTFVFSDSNEYYIQVFLDECFSKLAG